MSESGELERIIMKFYGNESEPFNGIGMPNLIASDSPLCESHQAELGWSEYSHSQALEIWGKETVDEVVSDTNAIIEAKSAEASEAGHGGSVGLNPPADDVELDEAQKRHQANMEKLLGSHQPNVKFDEATRSFVDKDYDLQKINFCLHMSHDDAEHEVRKVKRNEEIRKEFPVE